MTTKGILLCGAALFVLSAPIAFAQSGNTAPVHKPATIQQRKENQQDRIAQGVRSGQLTPAETARLERQQRSINHQERRMRRQNNGRLTRSDRRTIRRRQNRASRHIYRARHNARRVRG